MWADPLSSKLLFAFVPFLFIFFWVGHDVASVRRRFRDDLRAHSQRLAAASDDVLLEAYSLARGGFWRRLWFEVQRAVMAAVSITALVECSVADIALITKLFAMATLLIIFNQVLAPAFERPLAQRLIAALLDPASARVTADASAPANTQ